MKCLEQQLTSSCKRYMLMVMQSGEKPSAKRRIQVIFRELDDSKNCSNRGGMKSSGIKALSFTKVITQDLGQLLTRDEDNIHGFVVSKQTAEQIGNCTTTCKFTEECKI